MCSFVFNIDLPTLSSMAGLTLSALTQLWGVAVSPRCVGLWFHGLSRELCISDVECVTCQVQCGQLPLCFLGSKRFIVLDVLELLCIYFVYICFYC